MHRRRTGVLDRVPLFNHSIEISDDSGKVTCRDSCITGPEVIRENDAKFAAGGRGRWNNENETFNVLKARGYNLKHNFGHGKQHLATALAILSLPAFTCHTVCEPGASARQAATRELVTRWGAFAEPAKHHYLSRVPDLGPPHRDPGARHQSDHECSRKKSSRR